MTFDELVDFLENRISMSHVYQPLLIRTLVDGGGSATIRQIAQAFLVQDESQIQYYESRIKSMPIQVLRKHRVVERDNDVVRLTVSKLTFEQQARIRLLCEQLLQGYIEKRGLGIWDHRMLESDPVGESVRYSVLKRAEGRCELCGATKKQRVLHIDHIIPRSKRGSNDPSNLQVLCSRCNLAKSNRDTADLRESIKASREPGCPFCEAVDDERVVASNDLALAIRDAFAVSAMHTLVLPKRHTADYFTMTEQERHACDSLLRVVRNQIADDDTSVRGFNVGVNCGEPAGQTVMHAHIHLIPRRTGDTSEPRGGVRGVIPDKMSY